jgi:hypothetical protein
MAFPPWWANRDEVEISFLFFSSPPAAGNDGCEALRRFRCDDQIRIAGTCREIRPARS